MAPDPDPTRFGYESGEAGGTPDPVKRHRFDIRTVIAVAIGLAALILGLLLGYSAAVPRQSEVEALESEKAAALDHSETLSDEIAQMREQIEALETEVDQLDERESELNEREAGLDGRETELDSREESLDARETELDERDSAISQEEEEIASNTIPGDGIWVVGDEIEPGTYKAQGSGSGCYWARLGSLDTFDILNNHFGSANVSVEIKSSDFAFETSGCGAWIKQ